MPHRSQRSKQKLVAESDRPARRSRGRGRVTKALLLGGVVALVAKPEVRNRLLDALFGAEEQFEYESVTEPVAPPIAPEHGDGGEHVAAGAGAPTPDWQPPEDDRPHADVEQEPATPDGPLSAGDEAPAPAFESWTAPAAVDAPEEPPTAIHEPWPGSAEAAPAPEESRSPSAEAAPAPEEPWPASAEAAPAPEEPPTAIHEPWSASAEAAPTPEEPPTAIHEPWSASAEAAPTPEEPPTVVREPWSGSGEAAAAPEEPASSSWADVALPEEPSTVVYESWLSKDEAAPAPEAAPTVAYEPWLPGGEAAPATEEPGSVSGEAVAGPEEPWSSSGESSAARDDEPELIVYREAARLSSPEPAGGGESSAWIEPAEDFEADLPEPSPVSTLDHGEPAGEDSVAAVGEGSADQAEAEPEAKEQPKKPAIGEAESPRSGWWMPRRRRPDGGTREPPRWD